VDNRDANFTAPTASVGDSAPSGAVAVETVRAASAAEWRAAFAAAENATFFHGPVWAELWAEYTRGAVAPAPRLVEFSDGATAVIGTTRTPTRIPFVKRDELAPEGNCGGWVSGHTLAGRHRRGLVDIVLESSSLVWRIGPHDPEVHSLAPPDARREVTHVIDLSAGAPEARRRWRKGARHAALRALRTGVRVREARGTGDWRRFADVYRQCAGGWARPVVVYRPELFDLLARRTEDGVRLWLAEVDGAPTAGAVLLRHGAYTTWWLGASLRSQPSGAMNALQWELIGQLASEGCRVYDLNGSAGLDGVVAFKQHIGAAATPVLAVDRPHPLQRLARRALGRTRR
jgi:Acetyltransferase (GNAT) domain